MNTKEISTPGFTEKQVKAGASVYSRFFLSIYDWVVLRYNCRFVFECPVPVMLDFYNSHVSANHLDIGVGTGFFLDKCRFPATDVRLSLMDLNANSLEAARKRLSRYDPQVYLRDVLEPFAIDGPAFDSIGMANLLHCLPGNMQTKSAVFEHARAVMKPGAVLFGFTILSGGIKHNWRSKQSLKIYNNRGVMTNLNDNLRDLEIGLQRYFPASLVKVVGCEAFFWASKEA